MIKLLITNLKHFFITTTVLLLILIGVGVYFGADANIGDNPLAFKLDGEGPHVFFSDNAYEVQYVRGSRDEGFYVEKHNYALGEPARAKVHFTLENSSFDILINPEITQPAVEYSDRKSVV